MTDLAAAKQVFWELFGQLPQENQDVAGELLFFLVQVAANADLNKMTSENLGTVFGEMAGIPVRDGKQLLKYLIDNYAYLFEVDVRRAASETHFLRKLIGHWKSVLSLVKMGDKIISIDSGGAVNIWDSESFESLKRLKADQRCFIPPLLMNSATKGTFLWTIFPDAIRVWRMEDFQLGNAKATKIEDKEIVRVANIVSADSASNSTHVWLAGERLEVYDAETNEKIRDLTDVVPGTDPVNWCVGAFGTQILVWRNRVLHVFEAASFEKVKEISAPEFHAKPTKFFQIHGLLWVAQDNGTITVVDPNTWTVKASVKQHTSSVYCIALVGHLVWSSSWDKTISLWNPDTCTHVQKLDNKHTDAISWIMPLWRAEFNGWDVWTGSWDRSIQIQFVPLSYLGGGAQGPPSPQVSPTASPQTSRTPSPSRGAEGGGSRPLLGVPGSQTPGATKKHRRKSSETGSNGAGHHRRKSSSGKKSPGPDSPGDPASALPDLPDTVQRAGSLPPARPPPMRPPRPPPSILLARVDLPAPLPEEPENGDDPATDAVLVPSSPRIELTPPPEDSDADAPEPFAPLPDALPLPPPLDEAALPPPLVVDPVALPPPLAE